MKKNKKVDRHLWQRFLGIATPYWQQEEKWKAWGLLTLLVLLLLGQTKFAVLFNEQTGEFTSALAAGDTNRFWDSIKLCLGLVVFAVPIYACFYFVRDKLGIYWRRWLTHRFLDSYFSKRRYYELNADTGIDNPDQRIAEDINTFTQRSLFFLFILIGSTLQLIAFSSVLWSISHVLVYFLVLYSIAGTLLTVFIFGKPLIGINFLQLKREADFRFSLVRVRENAESIAFYRGEKQELKQLKQRFAEAFKNFNQLIKSQFFLNLFQYGYSMLTIVVPSAIIADQVLSGELEVGRAVQAAGAFAAVLTAISLIVDNFESLSRFAAGVDRLNTFALAMAGEVNSDPYGKTNGKTGGKARAGGVIQSVVETNLALEDVTLQTPNYERILVRNLSISIDPGDGLMIVGESGCGKSSLLRAIAGLWYSGSGKIIRPQLEDMLFLPQRPYMLMGTLRSQLLYPNKDKTIPEAELLALLVSVNLPDLAKRFGGLDVEIDWGHVLSIGEQQRLAFARVLLTKPRYAILDEATSALDSANEEMLYEQLIASETTLVSVGHRSTILKYHKHVLELTGNGEWLRHLAKGYNFNH